MISASSRYLFLRLLQILHKPISNFKIYYWSKKNPNLYLGSIQKNQIQKLEGGFIGLALAPRNFHEIRCDVSNSDLPFDSNSINKVQSEDVFEHIEFEYLPRVCNEIFRVLRPGGVFRLSVPDYNSIVLKKRSIYDFEGSIMADPLTGSSIYYDSRIEKTLVKHRQDGNSHMWFPTKVLIDELIQKSDLRFCDSVKFWHCYLPSEGHLVESFPDLLMPVSRCPPNDMRANGMPISIVVDFIK